MNAVSPGAIDTPGLSELLASSETGQQRWKMVSDAIPLGRRRWREELKKGECIGIGWHGGERYRLRDELLRRLSGTHGRAGGSVSSNAEIA